VVTVVAVVGFLAVVGLVAVVSRHSLRRDKYVDLLNQVSGENLQYDSMKTMEEVLPLYRQ
jgi:hypothetical protein